MSSFRLTRPSPDEYAPFYATYVARVPAGDLVEILGTQHRDTLRLLTPLEESRAVHRYAPGKWSVKEVVAHVADAERVFAYRALRFARGDEKPLAGFDENLWVAGGGFDRRPFRDLIGELGAVRAATVALFAGFDEAAWLRRGKANDLSVSVRALGTVIAGHEAHHIAILRERYGLGG